MKATLIIILILLYIFAYMWGFNDGKNMVYKEWQDACDEDFEDD